MVVRPESWEKEQDGVYAQCLFLVYGSYDLPQYACLSLPNTEWANQRLPECILVYFSAHSSLDSTTRHITADAVVHPFSVKANSKISRQWLDGPGIK